MIEGEREVEEALFRRKIVSDRSTVDWLKPYIGYRSNAEVLMYGLG